MEILNAQKRVTVSELSREFSVSEVTIRQDLSLLESKGLLTRTHGGAIPHQELVPDLSFVQKQTENLDKKQAIARKALELIKENESIFLDAGTTTFELAKLLKDKKTLSIATNAVPIAYEMADSSVPVRLVGGDLRKTSMAVHGPMAHEMIKKIFFDKLFLATRAVSLEHGLGSPSVEEAETKKAMICSAREIILLADSSKMNKVAFAPFAKITEIHKLVTDRGASESFLDKLRDLGIEVLLA